MTSLVRVIATGNVARVAVRDVAYQSQHVAALAIGSTAPQLVRVFSTLPPEQAPKNNSYVDSKDAAANAIAGTDKRDSIAPPADPILTVKHGPITITQKVNQWAPGNPERFADGKEMTLSPTPKVKYVLHCLFVYQLDVPSLSLSFFSPTHHHILNPSSGFSIPVECST